MLSKRKEKKKWSKNIMNSLTIKQKIETARDRFSEFFELPNEVVAGSAKITSIENKSVLIEGYKKIIDYYNNYIKIKTNNMNVVIDGANLDIKEITDSELLIEGDIYSINYNK
ncbi:MAG: YabP/YqfC family sporulation protein [Clostridia bacterium]